MYRYIIDIDRYRYRYIERSIDIDIDIEIYDSQKKKHFKNISAWCLLQVSVQNFL